MHSASGQADIIAFLTSAVATLPQVHDSPHWHAPLFEQEQSAHWSHEKTISAILKVLGVILDTRSRLLVRREGQHGG